MQVDESAKQALMRVCEGDCRRLVNLMQASNTKKISAESIHELAGLIKPEGLKEMLDLALKADLVNARKGLVRILSSGLSGTDVVKLIQQSVWDLDIDKTKKLACIDKCGECEFRLVEGSDEFIQLEALLAQFGLLSS